MKKEISGFSVIELVIALAAGAIVVTMAAPTMTALVSSSRLTGTTNSLTTAINFARMEAIRRQVTMSVVPSQTGNWEGGWEVRQGGFNGTAVRKFPAPHSSLYVRSVDNSVQSYDFNARGFFSIPAGDSIEVCNDTGGTGRLITITGSGKVDLNASYSPCPAQ